MSARARPSLLPRAGDRGRTTGHATSGAAAGVHGSERRYARIYAVVRRIPRGKVATYGQVAALAGLERHARLAGYALHAMGDRAGFPWHRVVGAGGRLSLMRKSPDSGVTQRIRLEHEGVRFDGRGRVDMATYGWRRAPRR